MKIFTVTCPHCSADQGVPSYLSGKSFTCTSCRIEFGLPEFPVPIKQPPTPKGRVTVRRTKAAVGFLLKATVVIDGTPYLELSNDDMFTRELNAGTHTIGFRYTSQESTPLYEFTISEGQHAEIDVQVGRFPPVRAREKATALRQIDGIVTIKDAAELNPAEEKSAMGKSLATSMASISAVGGVGTTCLILALGRDSSDVTGRVLAVAGLLSYIFAAFLWIHKIRSRMNGE